jgi:phosphoglycolate phosphatase
VVLNLLHSNGVILGIASNKFGRFSRGVLMHLGVSDYFKSVIGAGAVARNKPFPDMIHTVLREMSLSPEEVIFVGDTLTDIETGKQARVDVYALSTGFHSKKELSRGKPKRSEKPPRIGPGRQKSFILADKARTVDHQRQRGLGLGYVF